MLINSKSEKNLFGAMFTKTKQKKEFKNRLCMNRPSFDSVLNKMYFVTQSSKVL